MLSDILKTEFTAVMQELIEAYDNKGMRASGKWVNSLEVVIEPNRSILLGEEYSQQLETGRLSGKQPPSDVIEQWIVDKGISSQIDNAISISSLAFLIARKIGKEGWNRQGYGGVDLISEVITDQRLQKMIEKVGEEKLAAYSSEIIFMLEQLAAA